MSHALAEKFDSIMYYGGLTYGAHPVSCAAAVATLGIYEDGRADRERGADG